MHGKEIFMFGNFNIFNLLINVPTTLIALSFHELAHGWVSYKLGDPTPKNQGRLTLNPFAHLDLIGTLLMIFTGFGWAKPVMINPMYYRDQVKGMSLVALAGPLMNFLLAFVSVLLGAFLTYGLNMVGVGYNTLRIIQIVISTFAIRNLCFMVFNLIPFPPLDGFKVAGVFMRRETYYKILNYEQYIMYILMFLCITGVFSNTIGTAVTWFYRLILRSVSGIFNIFI